jgi:hypothetical protein
MSPAIRNVLAVAVGIVVGSIVNMALITVSGQVIPPPEGIDPTSVESLKENIHLFEAKHFIFPFLAHALGALIGAYLAARIGVGNKMRLAYIVGAFFLLGGIANVFMLPAPVWFIILDVVVAYIPMAWIGGTLGMK